MKAEEELKPIYTSKYKITETGQVLKRTKDELKDEMKDKISMALKDPVLQQGFEIICKNLVELEKENSELKGIKDIATLIRANNDTVITLMQLNNMLVSKNQQLTKAKEIIKKFSEFVNNEVEFDPEHPQEHTDLWNELCEKAEQFISEVVKNDR